MTTGVRYIVDDTEAATAFYTSQLGFRAEMGPVNGFAMLVREDLRLFLNEPGAGSAGLAGADHAGGPAPGGWNRFQLEVPDLDATVEQLTSMGAHFRGEPAAGRGGRQILLEDPSGNVVELFERATG
jgi:catechol 2,3-dioxygenase-like lactoylglutathione lyase family enzyme